jgi:DNA-binding LacI/PurR family transcriptional regulator
MADWHRATTSKQLADYLCGELASGRWHGMMPGVIRLAGELGVSRDAVEAALSELEREGLLQSQGRGKRRLIVAEGVGTRKRPLRVVVLLGEPADQSADYFVEMIHSLREAGHHAEFAPKTQIELGYKAARVARMVKSTPADAWLIFSGAREVLEWFAASRIPAFAFAGRSARVPITSIAPDKMTPTRIAIRRLVELGHRKIVLLCRPHRVVPEPGLFERAFVGELEAQGITTGPYHLQTWDETAGGYQKALESLFRFTPPTALFVEESPFVAVVFQFCMKRGLRVPDDFSLICTDPDPAFEWCNPSIAHIRWDSRQLIRRVIRWVENLRSGKDDRKKGFFKAHFVEGGTIGPVPMAKLESR